MRTIDELFAQSCKDGYLNFCEDITATKMLHTEAAAGLQAWLRDTHKIHICVFYITNRECEPLAGWAAQCYNLLTGELWNADDSLKNLDSYEAALMAGIDHVLNCFDDVPA